jgi:hypothetical protein
LPRAHNDLRAVASLPSSPKSSHACGLKGPTRIPRALSFSASHAGEKRGSALAAVSGKGEARNSATAAPVAHVGKMRRTRRGAARKEWRAEQKAVQNERKVRHM